MTEFWQLTFPMPGQSENHARAAEDAGWDGLFFADTQCLSGDIYSAMCLAAKATTTLKVGTAVTNPVTRHAAVTASAIATVQVESNGRAVLGIGRGDSSLGLLGQKPAPAARLADYVEQLQGYLRGGPVDLDGFASHISWINGSGQPKVPVDVASTGPQVIALAARFAERITFAMGADPVRIAQGVEMHGVLPRKQDVTPKNWGLALTSTSPAIATCNAPEISYEAAPELLHTSVVCRWQRAPAFRMHRSSSTSVLITIWPITRAAKQPTWKRCPMNSSAVLPLPVLRHYVWIDWVN